ncbi:hypothetical protein Q1695_006404 [Nippostrongylus brasiliensis]|nr:hypothetical protein Q1695_006404 [Nippostrongylus brasiliensis]
MKRQVEETPEEAEEPLQDVLYAGPKELCELKVGQVTAEGDLVNQEFELASLGGSGSSGANPPPPSSEERERVQRWATMEEHCATSADLHRADHRLLLSMDQLLRQMAKTLNEIKQGLPATQGQLEYRFASAAKVATLRKANDNPVKFVRALEKEVFEDSVEELEQRVDERQSIDRVHFLQECLYKFFDVHQALRDALWKKVKSSLNAKARKVRMHNRDREPLAVNENEPLPTSSGVWNDVFEFDE